MVASFEDQVSRTPQASALTFAGESLSYSELNERANRLAHCLLDLEVRPGSLVGIALDRSLEMVIAIVATLKAGAGYLPLDPDYPRARIDHMLRDAAPVAVVSYTVARGFLSPAPQAPILDQPGSSSSLPPFSPVKPPANASSLHPPS